MQFLRKICTDDQGQDIAEYTFWGCGNFCPNSAQQASTGSNKTAQNDTAQKLQAIVTARYCRSWVEWCRISNPRVAGSIPAGPTTQPIEYKTNWSDA